MLLDHFHPPLKGRRHWTGFHSRWAGNIAADLNRRLPSGWFAEPTVHWGIEVDVATFEEVVAAGVHSPGETAHWQPPAPARTISFPLTTDVVEVQVFRDFGDVPLVGVVELLSPANKDRPETHEAFVSKCDACLREMIGLAIIDVVTASNANLHSLLMRRSGEAEVVNDSLYAAAYRPVRRDEGGELDIWYEPLDLGGCLPSMPLFLKGGPGIRINFDETYRLTCDELRISDVAGQ